MQKALTGGTTTVYIFSGSAVIAEYDNGALPASPTRENICAGGQLLATVTAGNPPATSYYHSDHLSVRLTTEKAWNQSPNVVIGQTWNGLPQDFQGYTLVHEATHIASQTDDKGLWDYAFGKGGVDPLPSTQDYSLKFTRRISLGCPTRSGGNL